uniref:Reverse transcriptase domain-containing protein n=1 Tax=Tanacetum cinerariifolium TaxID=118510 RepID=A0A699J8H5_TANCI|nr:reverse transcriptase domain-containing protein [Tanacetum cinerariifolium]
MYVDGGSSSEILYEHYFNRFRPEIGAEEHSTSAWMNFMVVRSPSLYNDIIGRPRVRRIQAVPSTAHRMLKFLVAGGTVTLYSSKIIPLECTIVSGPGAQQLVIDQVTKEKIQVAIHPECLEQTIAIGSTLTEEAEHRLNTREGCLPIRQKKRGQAPERNKPIYEEVEKLVDPGIMKEVHYHSWLSNPVMVKEHDGSWRMMREGVFLGYKVNADGLKVCPDKVEAVLSFPSPKCLKDVQRLNGKLASLHRFLSKSAEKSLSLFKTLKKCTKKSDLQWTVEAEMAFKQMNTLIAELPMLTTPNEKEELVIYLAAAKEAVSTVLMMERDGKQVPIYFNSCVLHGPEINYTPMEKIT